MHQRQNIMTPEFRADPYPFYAEMRRASPVVQVEPGGIWAVSRYEDVEFIVKNPQTFSSEGFRVAWEPEWLGYNPLAHSLLAMDGSMHTKLRTLVGRAFGARTLTRLEPGIRELVSRLATNLAEPTEADFIADFALPLPAYVIGELIGVDPGLHHKFRRWADDVISVTPVPESPEHVARVRETIAEFTHYLTEIISARRETPRDDMVSDLIRAEVDGQSLTDSELVSFLVVLLLGGFDTTTHLLANALIFLAGQPELVARLRSNIALVPKFVEEMLRYDPPVHGIPRITTREVSIAGVTVPPGSLVLALLGSANRDDSRFLEPDRFDLERGQAGVAFGHGIHTCIGAALARFEVRLGLEALLTRFQGFEQLPGDVQWNRSLTTRGVGRLPMRFIPA
jgi:cytochrome P450